MNTVILRTRHGGLGKNVHIRTGKYVNGPLQLSPMNKKKKPSTGKTGIMNYGKVNKMLCETETGIQDASFH